MYQMARSWAPDAQVMKMQSMRLSEVKDGPPGTAPAWQATFVSAAKNQARSYTYSIVEGEGNLHKGAFAGPEEGWSGNRGMNSSFLMAAIKVDTDAAYKTAMETVRSHAAEYDKKNPGKPITILLERTRQAPRPSLAHHLGRIRRHVQLLGADRRLHRRVLGNAAVIKPRKHSRKDAKTSRTPICLLCVSALCVISRSSAYTLKLSSPPSPTSTVTVCPSLTAPCKSSFPSGVSIFF